MLEQLTPSQERLMLEVEQSWSNRLYSCPRVDEAQATLAVEWLYELSDLEKPIVLFVDSPLAAQFAANILAEMFDEARVQPVRDKVRAKVRDKVGDKVRAKVWAKVGAKVWDKVRDKVWAKVWAKVRDKVRAKVGDKVWAKVRAKVWAKVGAKVRDKVGDKVWDKVWAKVRDKVRDKVWAKVGDKVGETGLGWYEFANYGNLTDYGWVSQIDYFLRIGVLNGLEDVELKENFYRFAGLLKTGVYDMIQLDGFCIVSVMPTHIARNSKDDLHAENGPAIVFADGYEEYFWNGVSVEPEWINDPASVKRVTIIGEKNAERRRCIREIIGTKAYAELLQLEELDRDHVNDQDVILYRTKQRDDITGNYIHFVKVICHSTTREYFLCIPPEAATNAWGAVAWTFGKSKADYRPLIET